MSSAIPFSFAPQDQEIRGNEYILPTSNLPGSSLQNPVLFYVDDFGSTSATLMVLNSPEARNEAIRSHNMIVAEKCPYSPQTLTFNEERKCHQVQVLLKTTALTVMQLLSLYRQVTLSGLQFSGPLQFVWKDHQSIGPYNLYIISLPDPNAESLSLKYWVNALRLASLHGVKAIIGVSKPTDAELKEMGPLNTTFFDNTTTASQDAALLAATSISSSNSSSTEDVPLETIHDEE